MISEIIYLRNIHGAIIVHTKHIVSIVVTREAVTLNMSDGCEIHRSSTAQRKDAVEALNAAGYDIEN